ncbi:amino acid (threonine) efflux protein [Azoarcus sp. CIB]|uniref:LysE family translocator n=1 Tax=Aromatoleum sp. (strain CIB) TaxID=198107 RepID=UPI00067C2A37|nr:LysE family translocator [Azoarcus sp. CIB]AKU14042.1 amino acid (threonine) efflux protein [Azoarcus sp. CIB]
MTSVETTLAFFAVSVLLGAAPGPDNLFVLMQSAMRGRRAGMLVVLGLCTGLLGHTAAVAVGLAAVFAASPTAFTVLKFVGAAYLAWLAWQVLTAPDGGDPAVGEVAPDGWRMYVRGIVMNLTNPKVILFFLAFLPQFVEAGAAPVALQVMWLGFVFIVATLLTFGAIALFAASIGQRLRSSATARRVLNKSAGLVFLGLAARLVLAER